MESGGNDNQDLSSPLIQPSSPHSSASNNSDDDGDRYDSVSASVQGDLTRPSFVKSIANSLVAGDPIMSNDNLHTGEDGVENQLISEDVFHAEDRIHRGSRRPLNALTLAVLVFFNAAGGPFGFEPSIKAAENLHAIIGFAVMPILWALPEALMTYELSSMYPCASGGVRWLEEEFGTRSGMMVGYLGWIGGVTNNATYPVLFLNYILHQFYPDLVAEDQLNNLVRWGILSTMTFLLCYVNYRGLEFVGKTTTLIYIIAIAPVLLMVFIGIPQVDPERWLQTPPVNNIEFFDDDSLNDKGWFPVSTLGGIAVSPFVNNLYWNFNNFDQASHYSTSVPKKTLGRGMLISVALVSTAYLLPILIATGGTDISQDDWRAGSLAIAATKIAGRWLGNWIVLSSGISLLGSFFAEISADTMQVMGMADRAQIPSIFSHRSPHETPTYAILLSMVVIMCLLPLDFGLIVELANFSYCLSITLEFVAFAKIRIFDGDNSLIRKAFYLVIITFPMLFNVLVIALASYATYIYGAVMVVFGFLFVNARSIGTNCRRLARRSKNRKSEVIEETMDFANENRVDSSENREFIL